MQYKEKLFFSYTLLTILIENTISTTMYKYNVPWVKHHSAGSSYLLLSK